METSYIYDPGGLRRSKAVAGVSTQHVWEGKPVSWDNIATICGLLGCQPGDILEFVDGLSGPCHPARGHAYYVNKGVQV